MIYEWAVNNNMKFNSDKFQSVRFSHELSICYYYDDAGTLIGQHQVVKDLGIHVSSDTGFAHHIQLIIKKGKRNAGWIFRSLFTRNPGVVLTLLKQLVYPTVEYNSVLWNPQSQDHINRLESIQNNFPKRIYTEHNCSNYYDRLKLFKGAGNDIALSPPGRLSMVFIQIQG